MLAYGVYGVLSGRQPHILSIWGSDVTLTKKWSIRHVLSKIAYMGSDTICIGDMVSRERLIYQGCEPEKILIQPWGVDNTLFSPSARSMAIRNRFLGNSDGILLTMVSAIDPVYNIECLINALPLVKSDIPFKLILIGEGKQMGEIEKLALELGIPDCVAFLGRIPHDQIHEYYASADIYVDTSHPKDAGGGIGVAVMEAMSSGLPIICANRQGIEAAITDSINGFIFRGGESVELAEKISTLIADPGLRAMMGKTSRAIALKIGSWNQQMNELEFLYQRLIEKTSR